MADVNRKAMEARLTIRIDRQILGKLAKEGVRINRRISECVRFAIEDWLRKDGAK